MAVPALTQVNFDVATWAKKVADRAIVASYRLQLQAGFSQAWQAAALQGTWRQTVRGTQVVTVY